MNLPNLTSPIIRSSTVALFDANAQINPSEICADGSCNATQCCVKKFGIQKCLPNPSKYTGPIHCCGSIATKKGCCTTPDGQKFCN